jgi:hypothetical protein
VMGAGVVEAVAVSGDLAEAHPVAAARAGIGNQLCAALFRIFSKTVKNLPCSRSLNSFLILPWIWV